MLTTLIVTRLPLAALQIVLVVRLADFLSQEIDAGGRGAFDPNQGGARLA